jgi:hypothetical protein
VLAPRQSYHERRVFEPQSFWKKRNETREFNQFEYCHKRKWIITRKVAKGLKRLDG